MALELAYQDVGSGPPLVILHGLFGSGRNWTRIARQLGEAWRVYTLDLRNHGDSPWNDDVSYSAMASDLLMERLGGAEIDVDPALGTWNPGQLTVVPAS